MTLPAAMTFLLLILALVVAAKARLRLGDIRQKGSGNHRHD
jgi:hypothetical protein